MGFCFCVVDSLLLIKNHSSHRYRVKSDVAGCINFLLARYEVSSLTTCDYRMVAPARPEGLETCLGQETLEQENSRETTEYGERRIFV